MWPKVAAAHVMFSSPPSLARSLPRFSPAWAFVQQGFRHQDQPQRPEPAQNKDLFKMEMCDRSVFYLFFPPLNKNSLRTTCAYGYHRCE